MILKKSARRTEAIHLGTAAGDMCYEGSLPAVLSARTTAIKRRFRHMALCVLLLGFLMNGCVEQPSKETDPTHTQPAIQPTQTQAASTGDAAEEELPPVTLPQQTEPATEPTGERNPPVETKPTEETFPTEPTQPTQSTGESERNEDELPLVPVG